MSIHIGAIWQIWLNDCEWVQRLATWLVSTLSNIVLCMHPHCVFLFAVGFVDGVNSGSDSPPIFVGLAGQWFRDPGLAGVWNDVTAHQSGGKSAAERAQCPALGVGLSHEAVVHRDAHRHDGNV